MSRRGIARHDKEKPQDFYLEEPDTVVPRNLDHQVYSDTTLSKKMTIMCRNAQLSRLELSQADRVFSKIIDFLQISNRRSYQVLNLDFPEAFSGTRNSVPHIFRLLHSSSNSYLIGLPVRETRPGCYF